MLPEHHFILERLVTAVESIDCTLKRLVGSGLEIGAQKEHRDVATSTSGQGNDQLASLAGHTENRLPCTTHSTNIPPAAELDSADADERQGVLACQLAGTPTDIENTDPENLLKMCLEPAKECAFTQEEFEQSHLLVKQEVIDEEDCDVSDILPHTAHSHNERRAPEAELHSTSASAYQSALGCVLSETPTDNERGYPLKLLEMSPAPTEEDAFESSGAIAQEEFEHRHLMVKQEVIVIEDDQPIYDRLMRENEVMSDEAVSFVGDNEVQVHREMPIAHSLCKEGDSSVEFCEEISCNYSKILPEKNFFPNVQKELHNPQVGDVGDVQTMVVSGGTTLSGGGSLSRPRREQSAGKTCTTCGRNFKSSSDLKRHERTHSGVRPYSCSVCEKAFYLEGTLKQHLQVHSNDKPFKCAECGVSFRHKQTLERHNFTHSQKWPFTCEICGKGVYSSFALKRHILIHSRELLFDCDLCEASFRRKEDLVTHIRMHWGVKPFVCEYCTKAFYKRSSLKRHMRIHPGD